MEASCYKTHLTSRNLNYHYFYQPGVAKLQTLLFLHGFPSTSYDWHRQVTFFRERGFGVLVSDMLGYGGTAKPEEAEAYVPSLVTQDLVDLLDAEDIKRVVVVAHDWGCLPGSRLVNYFPERVSALVVLAMGYMAPQPKFDLQQVNELTKSMFGYEMYGYWHFMAKEGTADLLQAHWDSFFSMTFPYDPTMWKTDVAPINAAEAWIKAQKCTPLPSYINEAEKKKMSTNLQKHGLKAALNWYKLGVTGLIAKDDAGVRQDRYAVEQPVFFGAADKDYICIPDAQKPALAEHCKNLTIKHYDADHWLILSHHKEINDDVLSWLNSISL